ncbi:Uncharacterised protein [Flavonifractor plautii]|uniref:Uncharacterized protein n=1 Tax=Flavonifractor plautii TaxID=292800 RepID=A0A174E167_FLAPL|nr:Uncharacterised protein [Flavonifractor plautii]
MRSTTSRPTALTCRYTSLPIISDTSTLLDTVSLPGAAAKAMCSGRMPTVTLRSPTPFPVSSSWALPPSTTVASPTLSWYLPSFFSSSPSKKFIWGEPMKPATNRLAGWSNTSWGVPICWMKPSFMMTMRSPRVMASVWSWVT